MSTAPVRQRSRPRPRQTIAAISAIALVGTGCAPSLDHLLRTHQHGEALCAVTLPDQKATDADRARMIDRFVADADQQLFLRAVTRAELEASLGARGTQLNRDFVVIIVGFADNQPSMEAATSVRFVRGTRPLPMVAANDAAFAAALHERIPGDKTIVHQEGRLDRLARALSPDPARSAAAAVGGVATGILELMTLGIVPFTEIFPGKKPDRVTTVQPTDAQIRAAAPATMTVHDGLAQALRQLSPTWEPRAVILERPRDGEIPRVQVERRLLKNTKFGQRCQATVIFDQQLLPAPTLEESIARTFPGPPGLEHTGGVRPVRGFGSQRVGFPDRR